MGADVIETSRSRPTRAEIEPIAAELVRRYGAQVLATARRYSLSDHDADDAYQRGLEILLTKAPSTREADLLPWLKTVVKHEAFAIRRQRDRHAIPTEHEQLEPAPCHTADVHEHLERRRRLHVGAEAMGRLKPQEVRCLVLLAEGYSYAQIQEITGYSYTKVNRCLAEGRKRFVARVDGIESGAECERIAPLVSAFADGEASAEDAAAVRLHLRGCGGCRRSLRDARETPARVAALAPVGVVGWLHAKLTGAVVRAHQLAETAMAHKAAAVAASVAVAGGGTVATIETAAPAPKPHHRHHVHVHVRSPHLYLPPHVRAEAPRPRPTAHRRRRHSAAPRQAPVVHAATAPPAPAAPPAQPPARPAPAPRASAGGGGAAGEFGP